MAPWWSLSSGFFLGWSLGANDSANVFGTAVSTRMLRYRTAVWTCAVCVVLGAVLAGRGATEGLAQLGKIDAPTGAFIVALAAALTVAAMTRSGLPVSVSQAIVGSIVGWNVFQGHATDTRYLTRIVSTWVVCPVLGAAVAAAGYLLVARTIRSLRPHILYLDQATRAGLWLAGAFGAFSLGANNVANVVGPFVASGAWPAAMFGRGGGASDSGLLFVGGLAIAAGAVTYSRRVMETVGRNLLPLSPMAAWVVVVANGLVLFLFASAALRAWLSAAGLPTPPLIPVSSSQVVIGSVLGIALVQGGGRAVRQFNWRVLVGVVIGWLMTPLAAGLAAYGLLALTGADQ